MTVRSKLLASVTIPLLTGTQVVYTCPAGRTARIQNVTCWNSGAVAIGRSLNVAPSGGGAQVMANDNVPAGGALSYTPLIVLGPGDALFVGKGIAAAVDVTVHGVELDGVAP